jgi:AraC-like DNA-binding protein
MIFGQEVKELSGASLYTAPESNMVNPSVTPYGIERIEIITGGKVKFGNEFYGRGAIFRHMEGESTIHISAPGKPYRCLSLRFALKDKGRRDYPRLTFWQDKNTLSDFVKICVEKFHTPESPLDVLGAYIYSTINWHSSRSALDGEGGDIPKSIRIAINFLNAHTESSIPIEHLAKMNKLSKPYFQALFKKHTGTTPHQYHLTRRIGLACEKLTHGDEKISEIADECGFDNLESFYRAFRKTTAQTTAQYRRKHSAAFWSNENA